MCGPSHEQQLLEGKQSALSDLMMQDFRERFGQQSDLLLKLQASLQPTLQAGPDQQGMGPKERAALQTQSLDVTGANFANAKKALQTTLSSRGGGNVALPSGSEDQLQAVLASEGAGETSRQQLGITEADFSLGRQRYDRAVAGENALAGAFNPTAYSSGAESGYGQAFGEATKIQEMQNQKEAAIGGAIMKGAGALAGGFGNLDFTGASSGGEQASNFLTGAFG
jgi:hypothetical protein